MRILILGAGAVGLWVGGRLAYAGHQVTFVARGLGLEALRTRGLTLTFGDQTLRLHDFTVTPGVSEAFRDLPPYDLVCLTVKAYDAVGAAEELQRAWPHPLPVVTFQNGVGSQEAVTHILGGSSVIVGTLTTPVAMPAPATVEAGGGFRRGIGLAPTHPSQNPGPIVQAFREAGFPTRIYDDEQAMLWSKLLLNVLANATCAILDMTPGEVYADGRLFRLEHRAIHEALAVMRALGVGMVNLPGYPVRLLAPWLPELPSVVLQPALRHLVAGGRGGKMPSMHLDLSRRKGKTEVSYLNGAVAHFGREAGVPVPVNQVLTDVLEGLAAGRLAWDDFRRQPERLLAMIVPGAPSGPGAGAGVAERHPPRPGSTLHWPAHSGQPGRPV